MSLSIVAQKGRFKVAVFLSGSDIRWDVADEGVQRVVAFGEKFSTVLYAVEPGYVSSPERHTEEQGNYFVTGVAEWIVGEEGAEQTYLCEPGSLLIVSPNERHWNRVVGDEEVLVFTFFSPPREAHRSVAAVQPS